MDAAVLIRMWHWNLNKSGKELSRYINTGKEIEYINENNTLSINVSDNVNAMDLNFIYPQEKIKRNQYDESASDKEIILSHMDTLNGEYFNHCRVFRTEAAYTSFAIFDQRKGRYRRNCYLSNV